MGDACNHDGHLCQQANMQRAANNDTWIYSRRLKAMVRQVCIEPSTPPTDEAAQLARRRGRCGKLAPGGTLAARRAQLTPAQALAEVLDVAQNCQGHVHSLLEHLHSMGRQDVSAWRFL